MSKGWQRDKSGRVVFYYHLNGKQMKVPREQVTEQQHLRLTSN